LTIKTCFEKHCIECGKELKILEGHIHPIEGKNKCVCKQCWERLRNSENAYCQFIVKSLHEQDGLPCFVLINAAPKFEKKVYHELSHLEEISEVYGLLGKYDILAKIQMKNFDELSFFISSKVNTIKGVQNIKTLTGTFSSQDVDNKNG